MCFYFVYRGRVLMRRARIVRTPIADSTGQYVASRRGGAAEVKGNVLVWRLPFVGEASAAFDLPPALVVPTGHGIDLPGGDNAGAA
jgi:hypothetical protein